MTNFPYITNGPWRIHRAISVDSATIKYESDGQRELVTSESHADLALLRDAITEYLEAVEANR